MKMGEGTKRAWKELAHIYIITVHSAVLPEFHEARPHPQGS